MATTKKTKPTSKTTSAKAPARRSSTAQSAPAQVKAAEAGAEPTWGKSTILIKGGGMAPQKATVAQVEMPDGSVASWKAAEGLVVWPTVRLRIVFGHHELWHGKAGPEERAKAIRVAMKLAAITKLSWINQDIIGRNDVPILKPVPFTKTEAQKLIERTLFVEQKANGTPWVVLRTGEALSVRYDASMVVLEDSVQLHLPATAENAKLLEETLDALVDEVTFTWAGVGHGFGGWASALALVQSTIKPQPLKSVGIKTLEQRTPNAGTDWLVWTGGLMRETPAHEAIVDPLGKAASRSSARKGALTRIAVPQPASPDDAKGAQPAEKLAADLRDALKKINAIAYRAALRKPVPGAKR
jgi:hypothetical protein